LAGIITIFIGFGCMCGGFLSGIISDKMGLLNAGRFTLFYYFLCAVATFIAIYHGIY
jgi:predicted MFS family arabinose efflux permease